MKLSARNQIKGKVVEVRKGVTTAHVRIDIGNGTVITSSITNEAVDELGLSVADDPLRHKPRSYGCEIGVRAWLPRQAMPIRHIARRAGRTL